MNTDFTEMAEYFSFTAEGEEAERVIQTSGLLFITGHIGEKVSAHPLKGMCHGLYPLLIKNGLADNRAKKRLGKTAF